MPDCPKCDYQSETDQGVSVHHSLVHGESLVTDKSNCVCCGKEFEYYPSDKKGKYCSECSDNSWGNENLVCVEGEENPLYKNGDHVQVTAKCGVCGKEVNRTKKTVEDRDTILCSRECKSEWAQEKYTGEGNPMWKGGHHKEWYNNKKWDEVREEAKKRDNYECQSCSSEEMLDVHHKKPVREFNDYLSAHTLDNVVTLCRSCHRKVEVGGAEIND